MPEPHEEPLVVKLLTNPKTKDLGLKFGQAAMKAAGLQTEFTAHNMAAAAANNCMLILRAGAPPQYNKKRSPKSGVNLTKTSNQGLFKGALAKEERFARLLEGRKPKPHHIKDKKHLPLDPSDPDYQHTMQLDINMRDIMREVGPDGDLRILGFNKDTGQLRLAYKEGKGPLDVSFSGQFVINLKGGDPSPQFYSRPWDRPEHDPGWDPDAKMIKIPNYFREMDAFADPSVYIAFKEMYKKCSEHTFKLGYTEEKTDDPDPKDIIKAKVFANRPRNAEDFKQAMGEEHPLYAQIKDFTALTDILNKLGELELEGGKQAILDTYDKAGSIVAGDWDGMALGHPAGLDPKYSKVYNTFDPVEGINEMAGLMVASDAYLQQQKALAEAKPKAGRSPFERLILAIDNFDDIVSDFALARAGCITPHEFVFQQCINHAYRDEANLHLGEQYDMGALQTVMNKLLVELKADRILPDADIEALVVQQLKENATQNDVKPPNEVITNALVKHLLDHYKVAQAQVRDKPYTVPHLQHDVNVHDLYQHGFDMRNPYGSNLEGAWVLVDPNGGIVYGDTQEKLIEVMLTGKFLEKNIIDITHGADMTVGWDRIIERQLELKQTIPDKTMLAYATHIENQLTSGKDIELTDEFKQQFEGAMERLKATGNEIPVALNNLQTRIAPSPIVDTTAKFKDMKAQLKDMKAQLKADIENVEGQNHQRPTM